MVFDIDGTLANADHRLHHVKPAEGNKKNWGAFFAEAEKDEPYTHVANLTHMYRAAGYFVLLCTGRPANLRQATISWLDKHDIQWDTLLMRLTSERGPDYEVKKNTLIEFMKQRGYNLNQIEAVYEDKLTVAESFRKLGLPVFLCGDNWRKNESSDSSSNSSISSSTAG